MEENSHPAYSNCESFISQGDIYKLNVLAKYSSSQVQILRHESRSALTGELSNIKVFPLNEISQELASQEAIFADVRLLDYFIILSQTCDVSGEDAPANDYAHVAPMITLARFFREAKLPMSTKDQAGSPEKIQIAPTVKKYVNAEEADKITRSEESELLFPNVLRSVLQNWKPNNKDEQEKRFKSKLNSFLQNVASMQITSSYYIRGHSSLKIPESFVDLSTIFMIPTKELQDYKSHRIATIDSPYREEFSRRIGDYFSRVATPIPIRKKKF